MKLYITDKPVENLTFDTMVMSVNEFNDIHAHPFIASSKFDVVVIDLDSKVKIEYLGHLCGNVKVIPKYTGELTSYIVTALSTIYRDKAAALRFSFLRDKTECIKLIETIRQEFEWDMYY